MASQLFRPCDMCHQVSFFHRAKLFVLEIVMFLSLTMAGTLVVYLEWRGFKDVAGIDHISTPTPTPTPTAKQRSKPKKRVRCH
jgi:hypothetical protein